MTQYEPLGTVPDSDQQKQCGQAEAQQIPDERSVPFGKDPAERHANHDAKRKGAVRILGDDLVREQPVDSVLSSSLEHAFPAGEHRFDHLRVPKPFADALWHRRLAREDGSLHVDDAEDALGRQGRRLRHAAKILQIEPRESHGVHLVIRVSDGKSEIDSGLSRNATDLIFADRESTRFPGESKVQPIPAVDLVPPARGVAEQVAVRGEKAHRMVRFTVLRQQTRKILGAALPVAQQREENLRRGDHHLPGTLHDLPLLHGRQLDQPPELRARLVFRRSTPLDRAVDREQQRRQGRENHQNEDASAGF